MTPRQTRSFVFTESPSPSTASLPFTHSIFPMTSRLLPHPPGCQRQSHHRSPSNASLIRLSLLTTLLFIPTIPQQRTSRLTSRKVSARCLEVRKVRLLAFGAVSLNGITFVCFTTKEEAQAREWLLNTERTSQALSRTATSQAFTPTSFRMRL